QPRLRHRDGRHRHGQAGRRTGRGRGRTGVLPGPSPGRDGHLLPRREALQAPQAVVVVTRPGRTLATSLAVNGSQPDPGGAVLEVEDLTLRFEGVTAVDGVSFSVGAGELFALIGSNGAGKTSILNCLSGVY